MGEGPVTPDISERAGPFQCRVMVGICRIPIRIELNSQPHSWTLIVCIAVAYEFT